MYWSARHPEQGHLAWRSRTTPLHGAQSPLRRSGHQRLIKAFLGNESNPYSDDELDTVAKNCTLKEDAARKVEREMTKRIAAAAMCGRIGETFDAIVDRREPAWHVRAGY